MTGLWMSQESASSAVTACSNTLNTHLQALQADSALHTAAYLGKGGQILLTGLSWLEGP